MSTVVPLSVSVPLEIRGAGTRPQTSETGTRFHLSLNVSNIERVASFLQLVLGVAPVKWRADYAKFESDSRPLVLSFEPNPPQESGSLNHLGFRFGSTADLLNAQRRIEAAGISTQREEALSVATQSRQDSGSMIRISVCGSFTFWKATSSIGAVAKHWNKWWAIPHRVVSG